MIDGLVSVIIPTYNRQKTIVRAIESVLKQSYANIEVVVVDDCSKDRTGEVVKRLNDHRIHYYKLEKNSGACVARNVGIDVANGDYISFQDSDDEWLPDKLEKQLKYMEATNADVVFCNFNKVYENSKKNVIQPQGVPQGSVDFSELIKKSIISTQCVIAKKSCFNTIRFDSAMPRLQDWDIALSLAKEFSIYHIDEALVNMYVQDDSISSNPRKGIVALERLRDKYSDYLNMHDDVRRCWLIYLGNYKLASHINPKTEYKEALEIKHDMKICFKYILAKIGIIDLIYRKSKRIDY